MSMETVEPYGHFEGDTTTTPNMAQDEVEGDYATAGEMVSYVDPQIINDYLQIHGAKYRVKATKIERRSYSRRILVPQIIDSGSGTIAGYAFRESTAAAFATVSFHDGIDANAPVILELNLAENESTRDWYGIDGISYRNGLYVHVPEGTVAGNLFTVVETLV